MKRENIVKLIKGAKKNVETKRAKLIAKGFVQLMQCPSILVQACVFR